MYIVKVMIRITPLKKNRIFVTGASGNIGKKLLTQLLEKNYDVVALTRNKSGLSIRNPHLKIIEADILETKKYLKEIRECDYVYHLAVYQNPVDANNNEFIRVNVDGTKAILETLVRSKVKRFIYVSTAMVFKPTDKIARNEKWPKLITWTGNNYVDSKLLAFRIIDEYKTRIPIMTFYPTIVIDANEITFGNKSQNQGWHSFIRNIIGGGVPGAVMCMVGDKERVMNYIFLDNLTTVLINAMDRGKIGSDYILGGENITAENYLREIERIKQKKFLPIRIPIGLLKLVTIINIPQFKLIDFIVKNPPENMCMDSQRAIKDLGLKISKLENY